jgi:hypothetical protein
MRKKSGTDSRPRMTATDRELAEAMSFVTTGNLSEPELELIAIYRLAGVQTRADLLALMHWKRRATLEKGGA